MSQRHHVPAARADRATMFRPVKTNPGPFRLAALWVLLVALMVTSSACGGGAREPAEVTPSQLQFGVKMAKRGLWNEALFRFRAADRLDPQNPRIINNIAVAYEALGQFDKALEHYQEAVRAAPSNAELRKNYSRFVEFYRAYKPDETDGDTAAGS